MRVIEYRLEGIEDAEPLYRLVSTDGKLYEVGDRLVLRPHRLMVAQEARFPGAEVGSGGEGRPEADRSPRSPPRENFSTSSTPHFVSGNVTRSRQLPEHPAHS